MTGRVSLNHLIALFTLLVIILFTSIPAVASTTLDTTFKPVLSKAGQITGIVPLANSKVLVIGRFTSISGVARKNIALLNADGSVDTGFQLDSRIPSDYIYAAAVQADGKFLIGGQITVYGESESQNYLFRVSSAGTWDETFKPGRYVYSPAGTYGLDGVVRAIKVDTNGKILVGGDFSAPTNHIARLNPTDGSVDTSFTPGSGADDTVTHIALQSTGHIIIGGSFTTINGTVKAGVARLVGDGTLDSVAFGTGISGGSLKALAVQSDDKVLLGGDFTGLNGTYSLPKLLRTTATGTIDESFTQLVPYIDDQTGQTQYSTVATYFYVVTSLLAISDKIVVGGWTPGTIINNYPSNHAAQYFVLQQTEGAFVSFTLFKGKPTDVFALAKRSDGQPVAGGSFTQLDDGTDVYYYGLCMLSGTYYQPDTNFKPIVGGQAEVVSLALQDDGKLVAGGDFYLANGVLRNGLARFNSNGSLDDGFSSPFKTGEIVTSVLMRNGGNLIVGGSFSDRVTSLPYDLALLGSTGNISLTNAVGGGVKALVSYPGDTIVAATSYAPGIRRLAANLTVDDTFNPVSVITNNIQSDGELDRVNAVAVQPDGKILVGGSFTFVSGASHQNILRLNADGSVDDSFTSPVFTVTNFRSEVFSIALQADGKILLAGRFSTVGGVTRPTVVRLNANGTVDSSFVSPFGDTGSTAHTVFVQPDGLIVVGGGMQILVPDPPYFYDHLVRLKSDGSRDPNFNFSATGTVKTALVAPFGASGQLLSGGTIEAIDNTSLFGVTRITMPALQYLLTVSVAGDGYGVVTGTAPGTSDWTAAGATVLYDLDTVVTLTAQPYDGSVFSGWSGEGCSGSGSCTVTMSASRAVIATYSALPLTTLSVARIGTGGGSVFSIPSGIIDCPAVNCSTMIAIGSGVTLTAVPDASSTFGGWTGSCSGTAGCTLTMDTDKTVTATFNAAKAQIGGTGYPTLAAAYATEFGATPILLLDGDLGETLTVTKTVTLKGGYNAGFSGLTGLFTNLASPLTIKAGTLTAERLAVK